jgi:hypothetical protein
MKQSGARREQCQEYSLSGLIFGCADVAMMVEIGCGWARGNFAVAQSPGLELFCVRRYEL